MSASGAALRPVPRYLSDSAHVKTLILHPLSLYDYGCLVYTNSGVLQRREVVRFEWDPAKAELNFKKHGIRFEEAAKVFSDPFHVSDQDRFENGEYRHQTIGMINGFMVVLVAHTVRFENEEEVIRLISARRAEKTKRKYYDNGSFQSV
jgi:Uncharacterized protein conserved in bacteria